jgi:hypothetical protein
MRSVECPAAAVVAAHSTEVVVSVPLRRVASGPLRRAASGQQALQGFDPLPADSDLALASALLVQPRELDSQHLRLRTTYSCRGHFFPATTISSGSTVGLDLTIFIIISAFLAAALDASLPSSAQDFSGARPSVLSILLTTVTTIPITMERRRRRNRLW